MLRFLLDQKEQFCGTETKHYILTYVRYKPA